jgi:hypothetical protein
MMMNGMMAPAGNNTRRNNRKNNGSMMGGKKSRKNNNMMGGKKGRKASKWNLFTQKVYREMKKKMGKKASFSMALKEASRRKGEMKRM